MIQSRQKVVQQCQARRCIAAGLKRKAEKYGALDLDQASPPGLEGEAGSSGPVQHTRAQCACHGCATSGVVWFVLSVVDESASHRFDFDHLALTFPKRRLFLFRSLHAWSSHFRTRRPKRRACSGSASFYNPQYESRYVHCKEYGDFRIIFSPCG